MAKFKRGDVVRHQTFTNEIGVVTEVMRLDVGKTKMVILMDVKIQLHHIIKMPCYIVHILMTQDI